MSVDYESFARMLFNMLDKEKGYIYNLQLMYEAYETHFNIHDHDSGHDPFASVSVLPKEEHLKNGLYDTHLRIFRRLKVYEKLGINFDDYLNRPRYYINSLNRILVQELEMENKKVAKENSQIEKEMKAENNAMKKHAMQQVEMK